mgnify:CR=1 FL=1
MSDPDTGHLRTIVDTISDNAADAGIVLGGNVVRPHDVDLRWVGALLLRQLRGGQGSGSSAGIASSRHSARWSGSVEASMIAVMPALRNTSATLGRIGR